jgi:hypothetical protein
MLVFQQMPFFFVDIDHEIEDIRRHLLGVES